MHQPYYIDTVTSKSPRPCVRLDATKDYLHMAEVLRDHPQVHVTFNLVPSLIEQLQAYLKDKTTDRCVDLSLRYANNSPELYVMGVALPWEIAISTPDHQISLS